MKEFEEKDELNFPSTLNILKRKQQEQMEKQKKDREQKNSKIDSNKSESKTTITNSPKIREALNKKGVKDNLNALSLNTDAVQLIESSVFTASDILMKRDSSININEHFTKYIKRQQVLLDIFEDKLEFNFADDNQKSIYSQLNKTISKIVSETYGLKEDILKERFEILCNEVMENKKYWKGNEKVSPLLSIRARATTLEASLKCWEAVSEYPFVNNIESKSIDLFTMCIAVSKDIAINWNEDLGPIERQQLYISIVPIVADMAKSQWSSYVINQLDNNHKPINTIKDDIYNEIFEILTTKEVIKEKAKVSALKITDNIFEIMDSYTSNFNHIKPNILNRIKKTILKQIKKASFETLESIINSKNKEQLNNNIETEIENINEKIGSNIESMAPSINISQEKFLKDFKEGIVSMWGASQALYKIRR